MHVRLHRKLALMKDRQRRIRHESMLHFLKVVLLWQAVVGVSLFFLRWLVLRLSSIILPAFYLLKNTLIWKEGCLFKHAKKLYCSRLFVGILKLPKPQKLMLLISLPLKYFTILSCNTLVHLLWNHIHSINSNDLHAITCSPLVCFYLLRTLARNKSHRKSLLMNECWGIFSQAYKDGYIFSHLAGSMLRLRGSFSFFLNLHKDLRSMSVYHKHYFYMTRHKGIT